MILKANIKEACISLYSSKQRTILALIGIIIGIASVIAMVSVGKIVQEEAMRQFKAMGTDILTIRKGYSQGQGAKIRLKDAMAIPQNCPGISLVAPFVQGSGTILYAGKRLERTSPIGVTHSISILNKLKVLKGRFLSDLDQYSNFCVVGDSVYEEIAKLGGGDGIGEKIKLDDRLFTIVGVLKAVPGGGAQNFDANESIFTHITTMMRMNSSVDINTIKARVKPGLIHQVAQAQVSGYFARNLKMPDVKVTSPEELIKQMQKQMQMFTLLLGAIGSISLLVGGVGVMNVMLVSVSERRKEIGVRRALGAKRGDIKSQFLVESLILSIIGGIVGILQGIGISYLISQYSNWQFIVSPVAVYLGFGVSSAVGIFFGFYPAHQASKLDPIVALRAD